MFYRRALAQYLRSMPSIDLFDTNNVALSLAALYSESPVQSRIAHDDSPPAVALLTLLRQPRARLALAGAAGTGKTMLLHRLALACAAISGEFDDASALLGDWPDPPPIPLLVDLHADDEHALIAAPLRSAHTNQITSEVQRALDLGEALLLIDEADHAPERAAMLAARYSNCRVIVVGQHAETLATALPGCVQLTINPLDREQISTAVAAWTAATSARSLRSASDIADRSARIVGDLQVHPGLFQLAALPEVIALAVIADAAGLQLPQQRGVIVERLLHRIGARIAARLLGAPSPKDQIAILSRIAYDASATPDDTLHNAWVRAGILSDAPDSPPQIVHTLVRDVLRGRARAVAWRAGDMRLPDSSPHDHELIAQCVAALEADAAGSSALLLDDLLATGERGTIAAAIALTTLADAASHLTVQVEQTRERLLSLLGTRQLPIADRIHAGRLLGDLGDPRFADTPGPLVTIDGGTFILGADVPGNADEGPPHRVDLPAFQIGIYPVTNSEYARFLNANPEHAQPHYWRDPRFNNPSYPIVGVTWHDAMAYAAWLTSVLRARGALAAGSVVRLPLESEWEKAATWGPRGHKKHVFPWGDIWDPQRANTAVGRGEWLTTPVGCFAQGVSTYGLHDMIGNVWEWTASEYLSYPGATMSVHQPGSFVLRGLSCVLNAANARATYRGSHLPASYWRYHLGFRIVIGRPLMLRLDN